MMEAQTSEGIAILDDKGQRILLVVHLLDTFVVRDEERACHGFTLFVSDFQTPTVACILNINYLENTT